MAIDEEEIKAICSVIYPYFDYEYYRENYGISEIDDCINHYIIRGVREGCNPSRFFSTSYYLVSNPDVVAAGMNPFAHYLIYGQKEKRKSISEDEFNLRLPFVDVNDPSLSISEWEVPCIVDDIKVTDGLSDGLDSLMKMLNATDATATILRRHSNDWLIVFAGRSEEFFFLKKMRHFWGNVLFLRDKTNSYYSENPNLPIVDRLSTYINYLTGPRNGRTILLGQSYGGHASLYQSTYIENCIAFSFSPQAYHPLKYPHGIYFEKGIPKINPAECAPDLFEKIKESLLSPRYVICGISESSHDKTYYWGDALGAGLLASTGKVASIIVNRREHSTVRHLDPQKFFSALYHNYDIFYSDMSEGASIFINADLYYAIEEDDQD